MIMIKKIILFFSISVYLASCSSIPKVLQGDYSPLTPYQAKQQHITMEAVRWSGQIIQVINDENKTCFVVVSSETDSSLRPKRMIPKNGGRFIACKAEFLEPEAFADKLVTITGTLSQYTTEKVGEYDYEYPVVSTDKIYIWSHSRPPHHNFTPIILVNRNHYFCRFNSVGFCL
jgi:outer membrane lipoprotein